MNNPVPARSGTSVAGFDAGAPGVTPPSTRVRKGVFLTDVIVELGFADKQRIDDAEEAARSSGKTVEQLLLDKGVIDEKQLSLAIAERNGLDHVDLETFDVDMGAAELISRSVAASCGAVPIARAHDGILIVAVQDPFDSLAVRRIETTAKSDVRTAIATASAIRRVIEQLPDEPHQSSPASEVPRMKSPRELRVDDAERSGADDSEVPETEDPPEPEVAEPEVVEPEAPEPEVAEPTVAEALAAAVQAAAAQAGTADPEVLKPEAAAARAAAAQAGAADDLEVAKPHTPNSEKAESPADAVEDRPGEVDVKRDRELIETKGKVAELERRLEEVLAAAEEATGIGEKLSALRRAIKEGGR